MKKIVVHFQEWPDDDGGDLKPGDRVAHGYLWFEDGKWDARMEGSSSGSIFNDREAAIDYLMEQVDSSI